MNCVLSFTQEQSDLLMKIKNKLDSIHHGELEPAGYLLAFLDADAMRHFLAPRHGATTGKGPVHSGEKLTTHRDTLEFAFNHPGATAYVGFRLSLDESGYRWEFHSWTIHNGTLFDTRDETHDPIYVGVQWPADVVRRWGMSTINHQATA